MAHQIVIPRLGWSMEEGTFVNWLKKDGDFVRRGEALFELDGEKALQEIESVDEGILRIPSTGPQPGTVLKVGAVIGFLIADGEPTPEATSLRGPLARAACAADFELPVSPTPASADRSQAGPLPVPSHGSATVASPRARRVATELGIEWARLAGTGAGGRVREIDVRAAAREQSLATECSTWVRIPHSSRRRVIAQHVSASRQQTVSVTITTKADATNLVNLRRQFQAKRDTNLVPSYQDMLCKLVGEALKQHRLLAARWTEDAILLPAVHDLHLGVAVDTDDGLLVPVIRNVSELSLRGLAEQSRRLVERARAGRLLAADLQGGVFTITNLGAFGIDAFTPIINLPEAATLGLGAIRPEPAVVEDGQIAARQQLTLSLTFDHRIIDGAPAARFLKTLVAAIADPPDWLRDV